jgi:hypothetical membrane protein
MSYDSKPPSIIGPLNVYSLLSLAGIIGPLVLIICNLTAAFLAPGYSLVRDTVSSLARTNMGWLQTIGFLAVGLLVEVFSAGLFFGIRGARGFRIGIGLLVCFGFGLLLIGAFHEDPAGSQHTIQGMIHVVTADIVFSIFPIASLLIAISVRKDPYWKRLFLHTISSTSLAVIFVIGYLLVLGRVSWLGLYERVLVLNTVIWIEIMSFRLLRLSLTASEKLKRVTIF